MGMRVPSSFPEHLATLTDPRCPCAPNSRHLLMDILVIAVCAVMSGAEGWEDIEEYGKANAEWLGDLLDLARSEEHTSELQSQSNLVCRLLLEKKKKIKREHIICRCYI